MNLLPLALLALYGVTLRAVLRRFDPLPARTLVIGLAFTLAWFPGALVGGRVLLPLDNLRHLPPFENLPALTPPGNPVQRDLLLEVAPNRRAVGRAFARGEWPLWNELSGAGMPLLADPQSQALEPLTVFSRLAPEPLAFGLLASLRLFTAFVFTFAFCRHHHLDELPATLAAVSYAGCGYLVLWVSWPLAAVAVALPVVFYGLARVVQVGGRKDVVLLALAVAALCLGGHPETAFYSAVVAVLYAARELITLPRGRRRRAAFLLGAALLGGGLSAPATLLAVDYLPHTQRSELLERRNSRVLSGEARPAEQTLGERLRYLAPSFVPRAFGVPELGTYTGPDLNDHPGGGFVGSVALGFAAFGAFAWARARRAGGPWGFLLGLALGCWLLILRPWGPPALLLRWPILSQLPFEFGKLSFLANLALAVLAAHGAQSVLARWRHPALRGLVAGLTAVAAVQLIGLFGSAHTAQPRELFFPSTPELVWLQQHATEGRIAGLGDALLPNLGAFHGLADVRQANPAKPWSYVEWTKHLRGSTREATDLFERVDSPQLTRLGVRWLLVPTRWPRPPRLPVAARFPHLTVYQLPAVPLAPGTTAIWDDGHWKALVAGERVPTQRADGVFLTVNAANRPGEAVFLYRPAPFLGGLLLATIAVVTLLAVGLRPPRGASPQGG